MVGSTVMTTYNKKMYVIDDITYDVKLSHTFTQNKGKEWSEVTFMDYYKS